MTDCPNCAELQRRLSEASRPMTPKETQALQDELWAAHVGGGWRGSYLTKLINGARQWRPK